jgi:hypothetical protein
MEPLILTPENSRNRSGVKQIISCDINPSVVFYAALQKTVPEEPQSKGVSHPVGEWMTLE